MEPAAGLLLDWRLLAGRTLAALRLYQGRPLQKLGRAVDQSLAGQRTQAESRHRLLELLLLGGSLRSYARCQVPRGRTARGRRAEGIVQPINQPDCLLG